jgi:hypothetical protein
MRLTIAMCVFFSLCFVYPDTKLDTSSVVWIFMISLYAGILDVLYFETFRRK